MDAFAPIILDKYQNLLIKNPKNQIPFMTFAFETTLLERSIPAAIHKSDKTARAQILEYHQNRIMELIYLFFKKTGVPALLNTSFNLHGYLIVNSVKDAKEVFKSSELQSLWLEDHIIEK